MFAQFFVLNLRGEAIIFRDYRGTASKRTTEVFFKEVIAKKPAPPPCFCVEGVSYLYLKQQALYFVLTTYANAQPSYGLELLAQSAQLFRDHCGILSEEALRHNFTLVYEILDEMVDFGYPQATSTEQLKGFVLTAPVLVEGTSSMPLQSLESRVAQAVERIVAPSPSVTSVRSAQRPIAAPAPSGSASEDVISAVTGTRRPELFVDLTERLNVILGPSGQTITAEATGSVMLKNFLGASPEVAVSLTDDVPLSPSECNFHGSAAGGDTFASDRTLRVYPPEGELCLMNYRIASGVSLPFRVFPFVDEVSPTKVDVTVKISLEVPQNKHAGDVALRFNVPRGTASAFCTADCGNAEYDSANGVVVWTNKRMRGGAECAIRAKLTLDKPCANPRKEIGAITLDFVIPMWTPTRLGIRSLKVEGWGGSKQSQNPARWIRTLTVSKSYTRRIA
eukprot:m51a1_g2194 Adaptor protein complex 4 (AP-4), mu subunit (450) ;mRNA; f:133127-134992